MDRSLLEVLPLSVQQQLFDMPPHQRDELEEIRIRPGRPLELGFGPDKQPVASASMLTEEERLALLERLAQRSLYARDEELKQGYMTLAGGHRVGFSGRLMTHPERGVTFQHVTGFNIRIAREIVGTAEPLLPKLWDRSACRYRSTLVIGPPQCGKTTLLRDLARACSDGPHSSKVTLVDERSELAAMRRGVPSFQVGNRTDVLDNGPKAIAMQLAIRALSPDVLIVDEISTAADVAAVKDACYAGVAVIASAHASSLQEARARPLLDGLLQGSERAAFTAAITLSRAQRWSSGFAHVVQLL